MRQENAQMGERSSVAVEAAPGDSFKESCLRATVHKFRADDIERAFADRSGMRPGRFGKVDSGLFLPAGIEPYEVLETEGNALVYGGASAFFDTLIGAATVTVFDNTNGYLGVGNSATAWAATQTDLIGASKDRQGQESTYPQHTDGTGSSNDSAVWKSQWATGEGNFVWAEWGLFNASTAGRMLQRKVEALGTKTSAAVWTLTVTLDLT